MINSEKVMSLYVHIPFCVKKCYYCDFLSAPADEITREQYVQSLIREIQWNGPLYSNYQVDSIFIGGGTPSVLQASQIVSLLQTIQDSFRIMPDAEITIEMNPGTVNEDKLTACHRNGINRLSIGLQSANNEELKRLGRIHTYEEFLQTYETARRVGYTNISVDLMSGLPGQTKESYEATLRRIVALHPEHISSYSLIIEEGTPFWKLYGETHSSEEVQAGTEPIEPLPDEDTERFLYEDTDRILTQYGYERYEISNYAQRGYESRHNTGYWKRHNYLGLGLGASSLMENVRWKNQSDLNGYMAEAAEAHREEESVEKLSLQEQMEEYMFLGLRLMKGVSYEQFQEYFHSPMEEIYQEPIAKGIQNKLLMKVTEDTETYLRLTQRGIDVSNVVMADFLF